MTDNTNTSSLSDRALMLKWIRSHENPKQRQERIAKATQLHQAGQRLVK